MLRWMRTLVLGGGVLLAPLAAMAGGTADLMPHAAWAVPMSDSEMGAVRGGYLGFNIGFSGFIDSVGNVEGGFSLTPDGSPTVAPAPVIDPSNNQISTQIGSFQGFTGVLQLAIVPGDYNIVNNNLFVQVVIVNGSGDIPTMPFVPIAP